MSDMAEAPAGRWRRVFFGADGLRPGWGAALFVLILVTEAGLARLFVHFVLHVHPHPKAPVRALPFIINEAMMIVFMLVATMIMARIEGRRITAYGFATRDAGRLFAIGLPVGFLALSVVVGVMWAGGWLHFDGLLLHGVAIPAYGLLLGLGFVLVGVGEESVFRGYFFNALTRGIGFWPAALAVSGVFGLAHGWNPGENPSGLLNVVLASLFFCVLLRATGSLWCGMGVHAAWDWAQSFFYGTPDSSLMFRHHLLASHATGPVWLGGGKDGPEATAICVLVLAAGTAWLALRQRGRQPQTP